MAVGARSSFIEMSYRLSTQPELGTTHAIAGGSALDAPSPAPWLVAAIVAVLAFGVFARLARRGDRVALVERLSRAARRRRGGDIASIQAIRRLRSQLLELHKSFGATPIIRGVSLDVAPGERHAIIGPNGAGKSTLFNLISGRFAPTSGRDRC